MFLERLFSSYENVAEAEEEEEEEEPFVIDGKPAAAVAPTPRPPTMELPEDSPWLVGRQPDESLENFFARRAGEASWESALQFFEGLHARMCQGVGPENVFHYWNKIKRFAARMEDNIDYEFHTNTGLPPIW